jgi:hypothetical protein
MPENVINTVFHWLHEMKITASKKDIRQQMLSYTVFTLLIRITDLLIAINTENVKIKTARAGLTL